MATPVSAAHPRIITDNHTRNGRPSPPQAVTNQEPLAHLMATGNTPPNTTLATGAA